ncbi:MAG TPA: glycosyltransferase family 2 protein [Methylovirgula sp.]|nr:glycosyltransferase family 2 protein [Methylovirgula sp.]
MSAPFSNREQSLDLSIVIPCYNEEAGIPELLRRVAAAVAQAGIVSYEIVLIDDGSTDRTWPLIETATKNSPHVIGVALTKNHGHQLALSAGLATARGARVLVLDADLQDPPELLGPMMAVMDQGADVVYGQRLARKGETALKRLTAHWFYRVLDRVTDVQIPVDTGDFRLMSRRVVDILNTMPESQRFVRGLVSWIGLKQVPFPYQRDERFAGETKYPFRKMLQLAIDAITGFSTQPLRVASYFGVLFGLVGLLCLFYVLFSWLFAKSVRGWTSLITVVLLLGSAQLLVLGMIGEYLGRLYIESKRRPIYLIREVVRGAATEGKPIA